VDERLAGIDRALRQAGTGRTERMQIVEEVERQLWDMLTECHGEPTRREVLAALARLDPPEAFLPEDMQPTEQREDFAGREYMADHTSSVSVCAILATVFASLGTLATLFLPVMVFEGLELFLIVPVLVAALVFGIIAALQIRRSQGQLTGTVPAVIGIVFGSIMLFEALGWAVVILADVDEWGLIVGGLMKSILMGVLIIWPMTVWLSAPRG
jgi:hypothetical protein